MKEALKVVANTLVPVYETNKGIKVVYGSELHKVLGVSTPYRTWAERRLSDCDAEENKDYSSEQICTLVGGTPKKEHIICLDTAKEMAMLERNEKGKQVRKYFIDVEEKYNQEKNEEIPDKQENILRKFISQQMEFNSKVSIILEQISQKSATDSADKTKMIAQPSLIKREDMPDWICIKNETLNSQSRVVAKRLGCSQNEAIGLLVRFWFLSVRNLSEQFEVTEMGREEVEIALSIGKGESYNQSDAVDALIYAGLIRNGEDIKADNLDYWQDILIKEMWRKRKARERKRLERKRLRQNSN